MAVKKGPIELEQDTIGKMIELYCHGRRHQKEALCEECRALLVYARGRLEKCRFGQAKPTCAKCTVHCYKPEMRVRVKLVMRYAGPRMIFKHPVAAIRHLLKTIQ